jgi:hypothetical protein
MKLRQAIREMSDRFRSGDLNTPRVKGVLLFSLGIYGLLMLALGYAWYSEQWSSSFHFFNDAAEWKQMDKLAHFFWAFQVSALASRLLSWARLDEKFASKIGAGLGFLFVSCIEIPDGFSEMYGASLFDLLANLLGCSAFLAQRLLWSKIRIWPKFSFHPTAFALLRPAMLGDGILSQVLKDYNGQTFWYSLTIEKLPFPKWLTLAVGVGAEGMVYGRDHQNELMNFTPYRKYYLSVDLNLQWLKTSSPVLNSALYVFNIFKFPAPAIEISSQGIRFHPIYF